MSVDLEGILKLADLQFDYNSERTKNSPKKFPPIQCHLSTQLDFPEGCEVEIYGSQLPHDAPIALCLGEGAPSACSAGVRGLQPCLTPGPAGPEGLLIAARRAFAEVFRRAREHHSKGVYLIGHGIGALLAAKLLADKQFFQECPSTHLLQAVYLVSGIYDVRDESVRSLLRSGDLETDESKSPCGSPPQNTPKTPSLIENLVNNHRSFVDRNNVSFICDLNNQCPQFENVYFSESRKCRKAHGIQLTPEENLKISPVFRHIADLSPTDHKIDCRKNRCSVDFDLMSSALEELKIIKMLSDEAMESSPLLEDFSHLKKIGMRVYVFAAEQDGVGISKQSRDIFDCLANGCEQEDMHFQVKDKVNRSKMRELLRQDDNFLIRLLKYDIIKYG